MEASRRPHARRRTAHLAHRMVDGGQVHADLVGEPGPSGRPARPPRQPLEYLEVGDRRAGAVAASRHERPARPVAPDRGVDGALSASGCRSQAPGTRAAPRAPSSASAALGGLFVLAPGAAPRCSRSRRWTMPALGVAAPAAVRQRLGQRRSSYRAPGGSPGRGLVDHHQVPVLEHDLEIEVRLRAVGRLRPSIHTNALPCLCGGLRPRPAVPRTAPLSISRRPAAREATTLGAKKSRGAGRVTLLHVRRTGSVATSPRLRRGGRTPPPRCRRRPG